MILYLQEQLDMVYKTLPEASDTSILKWADSGGWGGFFMLHTWVLQLHVDLYRILLPSMRERMRPDLLCRIPFNFCAWAGNKAVAFACRLARLWETSWVTAQEGASGGNRPQLLTADPTFPSCIIKTTRILLIAKLYNFHEYAGDGTINDLIESNMKVLDPYLVMPNVEEAVCVPGCACLNPGAGDANR